MTPKLQWTVAPERDYARANTNPQLWLSVCNVGPECSPEWRGQALLLEDSHGVTLIEDTDVGRGDIVDAMATCEELATAAIVKLCGGLVR